MSSDTHSPAPSATPCTATAGASSHCISPNNPSVANAQGSPVAVLNNYADFTTPSGHSVGMSTGQSVQFTAGNSADHHVTVNTVGSNSVDVTVASDPINVHLAVGESKSVDVDDDGQNDITIKLASITGGKAVLEFAVVKEDKLSVGAEAAAKTPTKKKATFLATWFWPGLGLMVAGLVVGGVVLVRKKKLGSQAKVQETKEPAEPTSPPVPPS